MEISELVSMSASGKDVLSMNQIYFVGYDGIHSADFKYDIPEGFHCYLLVVTTTPALFRVQGEVREYPAHTAVLYPPNHEIWYAANNQPYGNHWLRFASTESYVTGFPRQAVPFPISDPDYCHSMFQLLTWETAPLASQVSDDTAGQDAGTVPQNAGNAMPVTGTVIQDRNAQMKYAISDSTQNNLISSQLLRILFNKLRNELANTSVTGHDHELLALRRQIAANPQFSWNVSDMAKSLHISPGYLQFLYKQKFNVSCMDDVISFRLFKARDLLIYTPESISEIAGLCGYNNTEHFCRQFHKVIGITPGQFRKDATCSQSTEPCL